MNRSLPALAVLLCSTLALGACSSARFGSFGSSPVRAAAVQPVAPQPEPEPVEAVPSGGVTAAPLPPLEGQVTAGAAPGASGLDVAAVAPPPAQPVVPASPTPAPQGRSALVGGWTAREASGATCRVQLSSSPALDLYKASAGNCANRELARVTAWDYRDGEVYLYQPGGAVAARLRTLGGGLEGVIAKSGAPLTLAR